MKKWLSLLLAALMVLGCTSALAQGVTVRLGIWPEDIDAGAIEAHNFYLAEFQKALPDVAIEKINYKYALDTFVSLAEAGTLPTVFETWYTEPQKLIKGGFVADITEELTELGWLDQMNPSIRTLLSDANGRVYGLPRDGYALGLMINAEVFEDAGLVDADGLPLYPKTWDELVEVGLKIKEAAGSAALCLLAADNAGGWHFSNIAWTFGAVLESQDENGKWIANLNSPEAVAAMQFVKDLKWKHDLLTSDPTSENWSTGFSQLGTGAASMYIAANDAVNQPTEGNGLPVDKLMMVGIPAGPGGAFSLSGGSPYMFSAKATHEEIMAALKYIEIMGKSPILTETVKQGMIADAKSRVERGVPVINSFPAWSNEEILQAARDVVAEYENVDSRMYSHYFDAVSAPGNLRMEEPIETQDMYAELTKVLQAVITDQNADVKALLDTANANFQALLDAKVNQ